MDMPPLARLDQLAETLHRLDRCQRNLPVPLTDQEHTDLREAGYAITALTVRLLAVEKALKPFADLVHIDGIDAPYPESEWAPMLQAAAAALKSSKS